MAPLSAGPGASAQGPRSNLSPRVLFVDDEPTVRSTFARAVGERGFLVDVAANAAEAVALAAENTYPVVATDLSMPGQDGVALIRELHLNSPLTVFVIVTGRDDVAIPNDAQFRDSVTSLVPKPWDTDELVQTLHRSVRLFESRSSYPPPDLNHHADRILLLEANDTDAELLAVYLQQGSHSSQVTRTTRLSSALKLLESERYGVIISDLTLPDARGLDAVTRIQNVAGDTPLVVISEVEDEMVAVQAVQAGAQDFLVKGGVDAAGLIRSLRYAKERKASELNLSRLAHFDPLTGLANRAHFKERLGHTLSRARRTGEPFAVLFVDLDNFKPVNDNLGHAAGDTLLVEVSRRLEGVTREYDTVARLGGDEFAVILDNLSDAAEATRIAERMLTAVARPYTLGDAAGRVTASVGIAFYPDAGETAGDLLKAADEAMYAAKRRGRNTYEVFQTPEHENGVPLLALCGELKHALKQNEFLLHYQPQHDIRAGRVVAAEGLLRWHRRRTRILPPGEFLPLLEESSEILWVGAWAIQAACRDLAGWRQQQIPVSRVSVNVSARQLDGNDLLHTVRQALERSGLPPHCLELEVTESSVMQDAERAKNILSQLKDWGVRIAMDDFGTGHSSLSYLYRMPVDTVKIDQSFVRDLADNRECRSVTSSIIALAKKMGLEVVAEGVENQFQRAFLENEGCDVLQGFLVGQPVSAFEYAEAMKFSHPPQRPSDRPTVLLPPPSKTPRPPNCRDRDPSV